MKFSPLLRLWLSCWPWLFLLACSDGSDGAANSATGDGLPVIPGFWSIDGIDSGADTANDATVGDGAAAADAPTGCPGAAGCPCVANADCDNAQCIDKADGKRCAENCVDSCTAVDERCRTVTAAGGDLVTICVPVFLHLCDPCDDGATCTSLGVSDADVVCAEHGPAQGAFCASRCTGDSECPSGYACHNVPVRAAGVATTAMAKVCVPGGGPDGGVGPCGCSPAAISGVKATTCTHSAIVDGTPIACQGTRSCGAKGLGDCTASLATAEACDGKDNDCDGATDEGLCDDNNACTTDACASKPSGAVDCSHVAITGPCDADGSVCSENDACKDGACLAGPSKVCDDANPCTSNSCDPVQGCIATADNNTACDDDNPCTKGETCSNGACMAKPEHIKTCVSANSCQAGTCDQATGACKYMDKPEGAACDDGDACTSGDGCINTFCVGKSVNCDDGNACTIDACTKGVGCTAAAKAGGCDDANPCTTVDACVDGACKGSATKECDDGNACTIDSCVPSQGCVHAPASGPCDDGNTCTKDDACSNSKCQGMQSCPLCPGKSDAECAAADDGNPCNGTLHCDIALDPPQCKAKPGSVVTCDQSGNTACMANMCDPKVGKCTGLVAIAEGKACDDGSACTKADACAGGVCVGKAVSCDDNNPCTSEGCESTLGCKSTPTPGACDDGDPCSVDDACAAGVCAAGKAKTCDDGNLCTADACDKGKGCASAFANGTPCSDGSACTSGDACSGGNCVGKAVVCDDNNPCTTDACDKATGCSHDASKAPCDDGNACTVGDTCGSGACQPGAAANCDDSNACTLDNCDPKLGCGHGAKPGACDDGDDCTKNDACQGDVCKGIGQSCSDGNLCTDDGCNSQGGCVHAANSKPCDDGNACTVGDVCNASSCTGGSGKSCDDGNPCTDDACKNGNCGTTPNFQSCSDNNACTSGDGCSNGTCKPGTPKSCNDSNPCTDDSCDPWSGCSYQANNAGCSDGNACTEDDACKGGGCQGGPTKDCSYLDGTCVVGKCSNGSCSKQSQTGTCSDGDACTSGDSCSGGSCVSGTPMNCNDNNPCTYDSCSGGGCGHKATNEGGSCGSGMVCKSGTCAAACPSKPSHTIDGCTGSNYVSSCASNCEGCKSEGGFIAYNQSGCSGKTCFQRFPSAGFNGFVVMYTRSSQTAYGQWAFPAALCGNYRIYADLPDPVALGLSDPVCKSWKFATGTYNLKTSGSSQQKSVSFGSAKGQSVLLFEGDLTGATAVTLGNSPTSDACQIMLLDRVRAVPY